MERLFFFYEETDFRLTNPQAHIQWIEHVIYKENHSVECLNYIFCTDEYLHKINVEYLDHDYYTDIITFDNSEEPNKIEADLFISIDRIEDNSSQLDLEFNTELRRVMVHGVLHLLGYNDKSASEVEEMRKKENAYLSLPHFNF